jgi:ZIP family zinc transporter
MENLLWVILLIFAGQTAGSAIGLLKKPSDRLLHSSVAFAASMMIGISFLELIPKGLQFASPFIVILSFFAGVVGFMVVDRILPHIHPEFIKSDKCCMRRSVNMLVVGISLHNLPEGLAIGIGFAIDPAMGILIAIAIAIQDIPENIATIVPLYCINKCKIRAFFIVSVTILFELAGFLLGYFFLRGVSLVILGVSLAIAAGLMVYISISELLPAAKLKEYPRTGAIALSLGILTVWLLGLLA